MFMFHPSSQQEVPEAWTLVIQEITKVTYLNELLKMLRMVKIGMTILVLIISCKT